MPRTAAISGEVAGTTHFSAVDGKGSIANMTSTIEGPFGSQLIAGGFFLNNELTDFTFAPEKDGAPVANRVEGGKRPLSSMAPTIVFDREGRPVLALGSAGGKRIIMHVTKTLIGVLDFRPAAQRSHCLAQHLFWWRCPAGRREDQLADNGAGAGQFWSAREARRSWVQGQRPAACRRAMDRRCRSAQRRQCCFGRQAGAADGHRWQQVARWCPRSQRGLNQTCLARKAALAFETARVRKRTTPRESFGG
jgi:hypothetical protein